MQPQDEADVVDQLDQSDSTDYGGYRGDKRLECHDVDRPLEVVDRRVPYRGTPPCSPQPGVSAESIAWVEFDAPTRQRRYALCKGSPVNDLSCVVCLRFCLGIGTIRTCCNIDCCCKVTPLSFRNTISTSRSSLARPATSFAFCNSCLPLLSIILNSIRSE